METFEALLRRDRSAVESYVRFRLHAAGDAEDVLQEVWMTAYQRFSQLKNRDSFKAWVISIARNKCNDYFRKKAADLGIPIDTVPERELSSGRQGISVVSTVRDTLELLGDRDRQILYLYYWMELPQAEIARRLHVPVGTVKSRLHTARENFRRQYPHRTETEETMMTKMPALMPEYSIAASGEAPFAVKWEELMGWFLIPKPGERLSWAMYDIPSRRCSSVCDMEVVGRAKVHGIEGVELTARETSCGSPQTVTDWRFVAQLTDTHCRYLATLRQDGDVRNYMTFLDGDDFLENWGFGEDNCGNETNLAPRGDIRRDGDDITCADKAFLLDVVGRYRVTLGGKVYDTICVMDVETYNSGVVSEQFLDRDGRTVLWRRFNRDDWALDRFGTPWSERLPENEQLRINGRTYVHWYDCITDRVL